MLILAAQIVAAGVSFTCTPTRVWDGDGPIWCAEGPRIRLAGIAARDESCRPGHPCPRASAVAARDHLVRLIGRPVGRTGEGHILVRASPLTCRSEGNGRGARTAAWCSTSTGTDLSCAMIRARMAARWGRYWRGRRC